MTCVTITYNGVEKSLADWGIAVPTRNVQNQAKDEFNFTIPMPMDGAAPFLFAGYIVVKIGRIASALNPVNPTFPNSILYTPDLEYSGGSQYFCGYCQEPRRVGNPTDEYLTYKAVGPYQFFFDRTIFQQVMLTWNSALRSMVADWQSDISLGLSLTILTGATDEVPNTSSTNLMTIAQTLKQIFMFAQAASAYMKANPTFFPFSAAIATWPAGNQFQCDQLTQEVDGVNFDLLETPSTNTLISDYFGTPLSFKTSASALPAGSYLMRPPLDAVNAAPCAECVRRVLQWLGGIGSPVLWTDHTTNPPTLHVATRDVLETTLLPLTGITIENEFRACTELIPTCVHYKYRVSGTELGQPYEVIINDVAAYIGGVLYEGIGEVGQLTTLAGASLSSGIQNQLMAMARTSGALVQTFDLAGNKTSALSCQLQTTALNLADPTGGGSSTAFWESIFPHLANVTGLKFFDATNLPATVTIPDTDTGIDTGAYPNMVNPGNQVAPWMLQGGTPANPTAGLAIQARITAYFDYQEQLPGANTVPGASVNHKQEFKDVTLTSLSAPSGATFYSAPSTVFGEPVPYGLAGYVLALESIPQYEGKFSVQETEIGQIIDAASMLGTALNITGGRAEWAGMTACIQEIDGNFDTGQTTITFGSAKHLGPSQFIARFRNQIGPRFSLLINNDPMNQSTNANGLSSKIAVTDATPGAKQMSFQSWFTNLAALQADDGSTLPDGLHADSGSVANPSGFPQGAQFIGASGGAAGTWFRVSVADLPSAGQAKFQQVTFCQGGATYTAYFLMTTPVASG